MELGCSALTITATQRNLASLLFFGVLTGFVFRDVLSDLSG